MSKVLVEDYEMQEIANSIRETLGSQQTMLPGSMPSYIRSIAKGEGGGTYDYPSYVIDEGKRVASGMISKQGASSLTGIFMSDSHEMGDTDHTDSTIIERYRRANLNAGQGAKVISDNIKLDFFAHLGDFAWGSKTSTMKDFAQSITNVRNYIFDVSRNTKSFFTPGNHDTATYAYAQNNDYFSQDVCDGLIGTYNYYDFVPKKTRLICLNTAEVDGMSVTSSGGTERMTGTQLQWFADALDLSSKSGYSSWKIIIISHHPLDWGNILPAANCLQAYIDGTSFSTTHNGVSVSKNFSGKNSAKVICQFHGHVHGFRVDYIHYRNSSGTIVPGTVKRIAIPNTCFGRNNEYGTNTGVDSNGLEFGYETTYNKTDNSAKNTAFCLVSVDLNKLIVYADCYGAGIDRVINCGSGEDAEVYLITNNLSKGAITSNGTGSVIKNNKYTTAISAETNYEITSVTVTMNGTDITSTAYDSNTGVITINEVTGDVVVTVTTKSAIVYNVTNLVLTSEEQTSTNIYNGVGYKNGVYASENGDGSDAECVATGWIPYSWMPASEIYIRGASVTNASHVRFYGYYSDKTTVSGSAYGNGTNLSNHFNVEEIEPGTYYKLTPLNTHSDIAYIRISLIGTGENLIITVNEPIVLEGGESGDDGTYENLVPTAVDRDGSTIFNGTGYMNGTYASNDHTGTDASCVTTGFIWLPSTTKTIYAKGATWDTTNGHCRMLVYNTTGGSTNMSHQIKANESNQLVSVEELGTNYYKFTILDIGHLGDHYYIMSFVGTGENLIITHDEPIE